MKGWATRSHRSHERLPTAACTQPRSTPVRAEADRDAPRVVDVRAGPIGPGQESHHPALEPPDVEIFPIAFLQMPRQPAFVEIVVGERHLNLFRETA